MACLGSYVLAKQLQKFGIQANNLITPKGVKNELLALLFDIYAVNGDALAEQYAGSEAFHKAGLTSSKEGEWKAKKENIMLLAMKRYFNNTLLDYDKQKMIWLFLGEFVPDPKESKHIWELDFKDAEKIAQDSKPCSLKWWKGCYAFYDERKLGYKYNPYKYESFDDPEEIDSYTKKITFKVIGSDVIEGNENMNELMNEKLRQFNLFVIFKK